MGAEQDRYLYLRGETYHYVRRVPLEVADVDPRSPAVRSSLKTSDLAIARLKRDALAAADDEYWGSLLGGDAFAAAKARHEAAVRRASALGFTYRSVADLIRGTSMDRGAREAVSATEALLDRIVVALSGKKADSPESMALLGTTQTPSATVSKAFDIYVDEIMPHELVGKSGLQRAAWKKVKKRAVENFKKIVGDVAISSITREQAQRFYQHWMAKVAPAEGAPSRSPSTGKRDMGNMRQLFAVYHKYIGDADRPNPFAGLSFREKKRKTRPPFSTKWLSEQFLASKKLLKLNGEARGIMLMLIETGARPSEIANLDERTIVLSGIPHIVVAPRNDPDDPREIKTSSSERVIPLVGVALEVAKAYPKGFPRYRNNERTLSNTLNKSLAAAGLLETDKHSAYSARHSFEDRMKEVRVDEELRKALMGHVIERPKYGSGGSLKLKHDELKKIELTFDPSIVKADQEQRTWSPARRANAGGRPRGS